jgi:hypothetical protein
VIDVLLWLLTAILVLAGLGIFAHARFA